MDAVIVPLTILNVLFVGIACYVTANSPPAAAPPKSAPSLTERQRAIERSSLLRDNETLARKREKQMQLKNAAPKNLRWSKPSPVFDNQVTNRRRVAKTDAAIKGLNAILAKYGKTINKADKADVARLLTDLRATGYVGTLAPTMTPATLASTMTPTTVTPATVTPTTVTPTTVTPTTVTPAIVTPAAVTPASFFG